MRALKIICWVVGTIIVLTGCGIWWLSAYISPQCIVQIIEKKCDQYMQADVKIGNLEYKLFHSYPWLEFEADSITIISKSLDGISSEEKLELPSDANFLTSIQKLEGKINLRSLFHNKLELRDIEIEKPLINIVMVNDSVSNFNIVPNMPHLSRIPEIDISEIEIVSPVDLRFFSLKDDVAAHLDINSFYLLKSDNSTYLVGFDGKGEGRYGKYSLPGEIPLTFKTSVKPNINDITVRLDSLSLSVSGISLDLRGDLFASRSGIDVNDTELHIRIDDLFSELNNLPTQLSEKITLPDGLEGNLPLDITTSLISPYHIDFDSFKDFNLRSLPQLFTEIKIEDANLCVLPPGRGKVSANDIYFEATCHFDPQNSEETNLIIKEIRLHGEGISLAGTGELNNITGEEQRFDGKLNFGSPLMETLSYLMPNSGINIAGYLRGNINFSGKALSLGRGGLRKIRLKGDWNSRVLSIKANETGTVSMKKMKGDFKARIPSYPLSNYSGTELTFDLSADTIDTQTNGVTMKLSDLILDFDVKDTISGTPNPFGLLVFHSGSMTLKDNDNLIETENVDLKLSGHLNSIPVANSSTFNVTESERDKYLESHITHTPLFLEYNGGGLVQTILDLASIRAEILVGKGKFVFPSYLLPVDFSGIELSTDLNDLRLMASNVTLGRTGFSLLGELKGVGSFMTASNPTLLKTFMDINFSNVDINQLAWSYYEALVRQGQDSVYYIPPLKPYTAADSVCIVIPRNIDADIRLKSESAEYMRYKFSPLSTNIIVKDGVASLNNLSVGTPYCTANIDWIYSTNQLDNIFMNLAARVKDFDFNRFYSVFPSLLDKAPELHNLSGTINADINCNFEMFPSMFMDAESLKGRFDIKASGLEFAREGKIEKITHLMLIEGDQPIQIQNINLNGSYHDNVFQINPFKINFNDYQLELAGINNTDGRMYYHFALEKSPFHLPFGVSLFGTFKHPEFRVGGTHIDDYRTEAVSTAVGAKLDINIMASLKNGWLMFVKEAAKYEGNKKD